MLDVTLQLAEDIPLLLYLIFYTYLARDSLLWHPVLLLLAVCYSVTSC